MIITNAKYWRIPDSEVNGVKKVYSNYEKICIFQPHRISRLKDLDLNLI